MKQIILDVIDSYEKRINSLSELIADTYSLIENYHKQRKTSLDKLRNNLAQEESLRKKDFDKMMSRVRLCHKEREQAVKEMIQKFIKEHKDMIAELKYFLGKEKENRYNEERKRIAQFKIKLRQIKNEQLDREHEVKKMLGRFKNKQESFNKVVNGLLDKGENIHTREVKQAIDQLV